MTKFLPGLLNHFEVFVKGEGKLNTWEGLSWLIEMPYNTPMALGNMANWAWL